MRNGRIDAVFMDFYGTFSADDWLAVDRTCRKVVASFGLGVSAQAFAVEWGEVFFRTIERSNHDMFKTLHACECDSLREVLRDRVGVFDPEPFVQVLKTYWQNPPLHADAVGLLERLDVPVCCVSNADREDVEAAVARHGLVFDACVTSEDARSYKPDPVIFHRAIEAMGVDPSRVLHVGDSLHSDVGGARALGIGTVWIHRDTRIHDVGNCRPDHTIRSLEALPDLVEQLRR